MGKKARLREEKYLGIIKKKLRKKYVVKKKGKPGKLNYEKYY